MDQVEEVKQKIDIVSVIGEHVQLKKAGRNFKGLCPFHQEKTPSFMVSQELQIFKCFGCSESGDVFSFLEKFEGMDFPEALKYLADRAGVILAPSMYKGRSEKEKYWEINDLAANFYHYILLNHISGKSALTYLKEKRGITDEVIETFKLGAAPDTPDALIRFLTGKKKIHKRDLERAGVAVYARGRHIDRFRGRVIFPLYDHRGNAVGLAGRILPEFESRDTGKYINSPETEVYHKSSILYGLNVTRGEIKRHKTAIVVEGEIDLISSWAAGIKNVVAIKGTALTEEQVRLLSRIADRVIIALDSDLAGDQASLRGVFLAADAGLTVKVARFGSFKDPDEAVRGDLEFYKKCLIDAQGVWDFVIDSIFSKHNASTGDGKARISRTIVPILSGITDKIVQSHYAGVVAKRLGVDVESVFEEINKKAQGTKDGEKEETVQEKEVGKSRKELLEESLFSLAFSLEPYEIFDRGEFGDIDFSPYTARVLEKFHEVGHNTGKQVFNLKVFADTLPPELGDRFAQIMLTEHATLEEDKRRQELELVIRELAVVNLKEKLNLLSKTISREEDGGSEGALEKAKREFNRISLRISELEAKLV